MAAESGNRSGKRGNREKGRGRVQKCVRFLEPQQMRGMPLLQSDNRYACLEVEEIDDILEMPKPPVMPKNPPTPRIKHPNWGKRLP